MGMFDEIRWDAALPPGHPPEHRLFQTKSLDQPCMDHYVVTPEGRLLLVGSGFADDPEFEEASLPPVDVEFHGDLRLGSVKGHYRYVARFVHGTMEWIRPLSDNEPWTTVGAAHVRAAARFRKIMPVFLNPLTPISLSRA